MGLMPAYRGGADAALGAEDGRASRRATPRAASTSTRGFVALFDGETGETRALLNAGGDHRRSARRRSPAVATRLLARERRARRSRSSAQACRRRSHLEAMRAVRDFDRVVVWSRTPGRAGAELDDVEEAATVEEARARRRRRRRPRPRRPSRSCSASWLKPRART